MNDAALPARFPRSRTWHAVDAASSQAGKVVTVCGLEVEASAVRRASVACDVNCERCKAKLAQRIFSAEGSADAWLARGKRTPTTHAALHAAIHRLADARSAGRDDRAALVAVYQAAQIAGVELSARAHTEAMGAYESLEAERDGVCAEIRVGLDGLFYAWDCSKRFGWGWLYAYRTETDAQRKVDQLKAAFGPKEAA